MIPLVLVLVQMAGLAAAGWYSPRWLRHAAVRLLTRADVLETVKSTRRARLEFWTEKVSERKTRRLEVV